MSWLGILPKKSLDFLKRLFLGPICLHYRTAQEWQDRGQRKGGWHAAKGHSMGLNLRPCKDSTRSARGCSTFGSLSLWGYSENGVSDGVTWDPCRRVKHNSSIRPCPTSFPIACTWMKTWELSGNLSLSQFVQVLLWMHLLKVPLNINYVPHNNLNR